MEKLTSITLPSNSLDVHLNVNTKENRHSLFMEDCVVQNTILCFKHWEIVLLYIKG